MHAHARYPSDCTVVPVVPKVRLVDRAIRIRAPIRFRQPIPSGITHEILISAGLVLLGTRLCEVDAVEYWSKDGNPWPSSLEAWP